MDSLWEGLTKFIQLPGSNVWISSKSVSVERKICFIPTPPSFDFDAFRRTSYYTKKGPKGKVFFEVWYNGGCEKSWDNYGFEAQKSFKWSHSERIWRRPKGCVKKIGISLFLPLVSINVVAVWTFFGLPVKVLVGLTGMRLQNRRFWTDRLFWLCPLRP